jgi:hypothetical protein
VEATGGLVGRHLAIVTVTRQDLTPLRRYRTGIVCEDGAGEGYIPLALNERPGIYTLEARDLLTGVTDTATVRIISAAGEAE